jgi:hypothetical protein
VLKARNLPHTTTLPTIKTLKMEKKLKVIEFNKKQKLLDFVNASAGKLEIVSISGSQYGSYQHFLWYYSI